MQGRVIVAIGGENLIDTVQSMSPNGEMLWTDNLGGSPFNVAVALARQGVTAQYLTPISTDAFGERLKTHLDDEGVLVAGPRIDAATTQAIVSLQDGVPHYRFLRENTAERGVSPSVIAAAMPDDATHFHAGSLAFAGGADAEAWEAAFHEAAQRGLTTSLDPNVRGSLINDPVAFRARFRRLLKSATIVKLSDEDLGWIYPDQTLEDAAAQLRNDCRAPLICLTKGPLGAECWAGTRHCAIENPDLNTLVDTIGAGDTFMATLLAYLAARNWLSPSAISAMSEQEIVDLQRRCLYAACLNCTQQGCNPPKAAAIDDALARGTI